MDSELIDLMKEIGKDAYVCAERRGHCSWDMNTIAKELQGELDELERTLILYDLGDLDVIEELEGMTDDNQFFNLYDEKLHNTMLDELADVFIICACWMDNRAANRYYSLAEMLFMEGVLQFISGGLPYPSKINYFLKTVRLKVRFNLIRANNGI